MRRRLSTLVPLPDAKVSTVAAALPRALPASAKQRCLNPECKRKILRPPTGRLPLFCGRACREAFDHERCQLVDDIAVLEAALNRGGGTYAERRKLSIELATRRWCLQRYPQIAA